MKTILELSDADLGLAREPATDRRDYAQREAARAVVSDPEGRVALLHVTKHSYYKLPGGGIDPGESVIQALVREIQEETGCQVEISDEIGMTIEHRDARKFSQVSYAYMARQIGRQEAPELTAKELDDGFELMWAADLEDAISLVEAARPKLYEAHHIRMRDLAILQESTRYRNREAAA